MVVFRNEKNECIEVQVSFASDGSKRVHFNNLDTNEVWYEEYTGKDKYEAIDNAIALYR